MSKESESYRLQMLRRLQQKDRGPPPTEVLEAEKVIAKYRKEQTQAREAIPRFSAPLPEPDLCPQCYGLHDQRIFLHAVPHADPSKFDRMKCQTCGYSEDRDAHPIEV